MQYGDFSRCGTAASGLPIAPATTINVNTEHDAAAGDDTIVLPAGHFVLTRAGKSEDLNATGDLDLFGTAPVTIAGAGAAGTTIDANGVDRVLQVLTNFQVTIRNVTITGGRPADGQPGANVSSTLTNATGGAGGAGERDRHEPRPDAHPNGLDARDPAGNASKPKRLTFRIVRGI